MRTFKIVIPSLFTLVVPFSIYAVDDQDSNYTQVSSPIKNICQPYLLKTSPPEDIPTDLDIQNLKKCDVTDLYYGIHQPVDYKLARLCAYAKKDYGVLTMIYANGKGVPRNWDLSIKFACQAGFAPAEIESRVQHLLDLRAKGDEKQDFDFCDDVTSGYMIGVCEAKTSLIDQAQRDKKLIALVTNWNDNEKTALKKLQRSAKNFFSIHSNNEVDLSGSARAALSIEEQDTLENDFLTSLEEFSQGHFPVYTKSQAVQYDQQLNALYQQIQKNADYSNGSITRQGIKKSQLAWLKYRDAWVEFGKVKYSQIDSQSWQIWLTKKRIDMLEELNS